MKFVVQIKFFFVIFSFICSVVFLCSHKKYKAEIIDNTFCIDILNESRFEVEIDSQKIMQGKMIQHNLPLHESALYDGWNVIYKIPISETAFYLHSEKITIADSQNALKIKNPRIVLETEIYIKIKNNSHASMQITSTGNNYLPVFLEGQINNRSTSVNYYIPSGRTGVIKVRNNLSLAIKNDNGVESILNNRIVSPGFVYTYEYDGNSAMLTDFRPLLSMGEETWETAVAENVSICKMLRRPDSNALYFAGTETALDAKGFPFLRGVAGRIEVSNTGAKSAAVEFCCDPFEIDGDAQFFDATLLDDGSIVAAGQVSSEKPCGIIVRYTADGAVSDFVVLEETIALGALCRGADDSSFFAGGIDSDGNIIIVSVLCETSIRCKKIISLPLPAGEMADGITLCHFAAKDFILLAVNIKDTDGFLLSRLYKISSDEGTINEINLQGKICVISSIVMSQNGDVFLAGETSVGAKTAACVLKARLDGQFCKAQFISPDTPSWISEAWLDELAGELTVCGMTVSGKNRVPFMRAFSMQDLQTLWEQTYVASPFKGLNDAAFLVPFADYGFLVGMSALDADNNRCAPFKIMRVNSIGKISKNHHTIQLKGAEKW